MRGIAARAKIAIGAKRCTAVIKINHVLLCVIAHGHVDIAVVVHVGQRQAIGRIAARAKIG